jgi:hypothetical protein
MMSPVMILNADKLDNFLIEGLVSKPGQISARSPKTSFLELAPQPHSLIWVQKTFGLEPQWSIKLNSRQYTNVLIYPLKLELSICRNINLMIRCFCTNLTRTYAHVREAYGTGILFP